MTQTSRLPGASLRSGAVATATSCAALAAVALAENKGAAQPFNATSHWLNGDAAARRRTVDLRHTGVGLTTHAAATVFWAAILEGWCAARPTRRPGTLLGRAVAVSALAAVVDYTITPRRFTPGWELVLSKPAMALVYAAMAGGFAAFR